MSETTHLKIVKGKQPDTWRVNAVTDDGQTHIEDVAIIKNWVPNGEPSIKVPYYIPNSMIDEIVKVVQESEPPA